MLWILVLSVALVTSIVDERSKELDKEYEELMGEKVLEGEPQEKAEEPTSKTEEADVGKFNPHEELHNEEFVKYANGEPYMMAKSKAKTEGYVCQQFTLPTDEGTSLVLLGVKDLNACKCACNERRGEAAETGHVGCNAFAFLPGQNTKAEEGVTTNECHLKKHYMYHAEWIKVVNPWIFCVQQGQGSGDTLAEVESEVASPAVVDSKTVTVAATSSLFTAVLAFGFFHYYYKAQAKAYLLLDDEI